MGQHEASLPSLETSLTPGSGPISVCLTPILARSSTLADLRLAPRAGRARLVRAAMTACYYRAYFAGERDQFRARVGNQFPGSRRFPRHLYSKNVRVKND